MTMISVRVDEQQVEELDRLAHALGRDRSDILRDALQRQLTVIAAEADAEAYERQPLTEEELSLRFAEDWGPEEDWSDWLDAEG